MKRIPNILSASRIALCLPLLLVDAMTVPFWVLYVIAGTTDMLDGFLARRWGVESKFGARLDSVADICFVVCCCWKLLPVLELPHWLWSWAGVIVIIKVINQVSALMMHGRCSFPHTIANKMTGFLLFLAVPMTFWSIIPIVIVTGIATIAAVHEGHIIRTKTIDVV